MRTSTVLTGFIAAGATAPLMAQEQSSTAPTTVRAPKNLADLPSGWREAMKDLGVPGMAVAVVQGDKVIMLETYGIRDPQSGGPVTAETAFYIASSTKSFTAVGIMQLVEKGKIDLDAPVKRYLPRFELADAELTKRLTIRDLLSHAQGIDSEAIVFLDAYTGEITEDLYYQHLRDAKITGSFEYTNVHYTILGRVITAVSGKSWKDYLNENIFVPAGMRNATCDADEMYGRSDVAFPTIRDGSGIRRSRVRKTNRTMHAAGGMGTSINDLSRWLLLNLNGGRVGETQILSAKGIESMHTLEVKSNRRGFRLPKRTPLGYGLGWFVGRYQDVPYIDHGGGYTGTSAAITLVPEHQIGVAVLGNSGVPLPHVVTGQLLDRLLNLKDTGLLSKLKQMTERRASRVEQVDASFGENPAVKHGGLSLTPGAYAGRYVSVDWGTVEVTLDDQVLTAKHGDLPLQLGSTGTDKFKYKSEGASLSDARFEIAGGAVVAVVGDFCPTGKDVRFERLPES